MPNNLPLNWCESTLDDIAEYLNGLAFKPSDWKETGLPIIRIQNLTNPKKEFNYTTKKFKNEYLINRGDILLSWSATLDVFIWQRENAWLNQHIFKVTPKKHMNDRFVFYILKNALYELIHSEFLHGSTMKHINRGPFLRHKILLPPLAEQERIVEKIEALFADIDEGVERLKSAQAQIKQYRQSVLKSAFEGKLYKTTDWKEVQLKDVCANIQYGYTESSNSSPIGPKFLRITDIQNDSVNWDTVPYCKISKEALSKYKLQKGDFVFARTGATVGKSYLLEDVPEKTVFASYLIRVRFNTQTVSKFIKYFFQSPRYWLQIIDKQAGIGQPNVNGTKLGQLEIILPTLPEQQHIVEEIEKRFAVADVLEKAVNEGLEKADKLKQSILKKAFEGKLVAQNPNDEPASILLNRIKKSQTPTKGKKNDA